MKRTVLFTGAGASAALGFPVTNQILKLIEDYIADDELFDEWRRGSFYRKQLKKYLRAMLPGYSNRTAGSISVTQLLSMVDHALETGLTLFPGRSMGDLQDLRRLLEWAITETVWWPDREQNGKRLKELIGWLREQNADRCHVSFISTNYDYSIEEELFRLHGRGYTKIAEDFDFGFNWRHPAGDAMYSRPRRPKFQVYKLHGSLNWAQCGMCNYIYVNVKEAPTYQLFAQTSENYANSCDCGHWPLQSLLVAPSFVRDIRDPNLLSTWNGAFEALRRAQEWIIVGYSMPPEDVAIRSMFFRAYQSRRRDGNATRIRVFQKRWIDPKLSASIQDYERKKADPVEANFKLLFPKCEYSLGGFEEFVDSLA